MSFRFGCSVEEQLAEAVGKIQPSTTVPAPLRKSIGRRPCRDTVLARREQVSSGQRRDTFTTFACFCTEFVRNGVGLLVTNLEESE